MAAWWWFRSRQANNPRADTADRLDTIAAWPPKVTRVMTTQERLAYSLLVRAFPDHIVLAQVPLSRFLRVPTRHSHAEWLRRVGQMCADLVVCDTASQPLAVIIVRSPGGATSERARVRHERLQRVLKAAEVRCQVWVENALPSLESARASVLEQSTLQVSPAMAIAAVTPRPALATAPNAFDDTKRDSTQGVVVDDQEPPSTWYDDIGSGPTPLQQNRPNPAKR
ncbi:MAG: DUF2726 domain-containing protein [Rhizobacter sp.]|nr:DUF2726 domain-containing protein [Rhizobacter sp.]